MKTPEQMAEEHANLRCPEQGTEFIVWCMCRDDFLAGYQAAQDQLADADKVMDTCEHILDMEKMVDVNCSNNLDGWISVKDRLPELCKPSHSIRRKSVCVLITSYNVVFVAHLAESCGTRSVCHFEACDCSCRGHDIELDEWTLDQVTYWMPLPEPPEEEK